MPVRAAHTLRQHDPALGLHFPVVEGGRMLRLRGSGRASSRGWGLRSWGCLGEGRDGRLAGSQVRAGCSALHCKSSAGRGECAKCSCLRGERGTTSAGTRVFERRTVTEGRSLEDVLLSRWRSQKQGTLSASETWLDMLH